MFFFSSACSTEVRKLSNIEITKKRSELFGRELARQRAHITKLEKIQIDFTGDGPHEPCSLLMNKGISTPYNCAMHIHELLMTRSVLALANGKPWDMHRPLEEDCNLNFVHFKDSDPHYVNKAFWRTGSYITGYILERAFKDEHLVELCSFPKPDITSGSFIYDAALNIPDWKPTVSELNCLSRIGGKLSHEEYKFERLDCDASVALKMFEDNRFKHAQIPSIAASSHSGSSVTLYRMGDHVDITRGPLIANTNQIGRFTLSAIHDIESDLGKLQRVQGLAIPKQLPMHYWSFELLAKRSANLNDAPVPTKPEEKIAHQAVNS